MKPEDLRVGMIVKSRVDLTSVGKKAARATPASALNSKSSPVVTKASPSSNTTPASSTSPKKSHPNDCFRMLDLARYIPHARV